MTPRPHLLTAYQIGWADGAASRGYLGPVRGEERLAAYARGFEDGKRAFASAVASERARLSMPPPAQEAR